MDGKLLAKGSKGECNGDVDLWGIEKPVAVGVALKICDEMISKTKELDKSLLRKTITSHILALQNMTCLVSKQMH